MPVSRSVFIAVMAAAMAMALAAGAQVKMGIFIGSNTGLASEPELQYATRDAERVYRTLLELGDLDSGRSELLLNPSPAKVAAAMDRAKAEVRALKEAGKAVQTVLYYSGHGSAAGFHLGKEVLSQQAIHGGIKAIGAQLQVLIADACYSGSLLRSKGGMLAPPLEIRYSDPAGTEGTAMMTSSSAEEVSSESNSLQGSLFTSYLLEGIRGEADYDRDGSITLWEAYTYSKARLKHKTYGAVGRRQTPNFSEDVKGSDPIVLTRVRVRTASAVPADSHVASLGKGGRTGTGASPGGVSLAYRMDPYFPERDEPSYQLGISIHGTGGDWGWSAGAAWLEPVSYPRRRYGVEKGYLFTLGINRSWALGPRAFGFAGIDPEFWWIRQAEGDVSAFPESETYPSWGPMFGLMGSFGVRIPIAPFLSIPIALHAGYCKPTLGLDDWVPNAGLSLSLLFHGIP